MSLSKTKWADWPSTGVESDGVLTLHRQVITRSVIVFDTETTGLQSDARIVEIACAEIDVTSGEVLRRAAQFVRPDITIPNDATKLHGISNAMVAEADPISVVLPRVLDWIAQSEAPLMAHYARYDVNRVVFEAERSSVSLRRARPVYCSMALARSILPRQRSYSLKDVAAYLKVPQPKAHRAMADVETTAKVAAILLKRAGKDLTECLKMEGEL